MGLYDTINVFMKCPFCGSYRHMEAQTKQLGRMMFTYEPLNKEWFSNKKFWKQERAVRQKLPCFRRFPMDKSAGVWKSQYERILAEATVPLEYSDYKSQKYVEVIASCDSKECATKIHNKDFKDGYYYQPRYFYGKIRIKDGFLIGAIYDISER